MSVLVLGGYGNFGKRISELLVRQNISVIICGRNRQKAEQLQKKLASPNADISIFDMHTELAAKLEELKPKVVINTCGPFQNQDYGAARTCIDQGIPYIDLADGRDYVNGIGELDDAAKKNGVIVISGASTVPALTSAVVEHFLGEFKQIDTLDFGIAPGQRAERGLATTQAILSYVGKQLKPCAGHPIRYGWQDLHSVTYPKVGKRWMATCEVPDLDLLPKRYGIGAIRFSAGMDVPLVHFGIWAMSWIVRIGLPLDLTKLAVPLLKISNLFDVFGSADGGMHVEMSGIGVDGKPLTKRWFILAYNSHGPYIPSVPAVVLAKRIIDGTLTDTGAYPCVGLMSLEDYLHELNHLEVECFTETEK